MHDFGTFCILRFLAGIGMGGALTINITLASEFAPAKIRGVMVSTMFTGFMIGPALAGVISILFIPTYGWRVVLFFALLPLVFIPFLVAFLPESVRFLARKKRYDKAIPILRRIEKAAHTPPQEWTDDSFALPALETKASVKALFSSKLAFVTILIWLIYFFNLLAMYSLTTWLPTLLNKSGISLVKSYGYTVIDHFGGFIGAMFLGAMLDRLGRKWTIAGASLLAAVVSVLFGQATGTPWALYLLSMAVGFFLIGGQSAQHAVTGEVYPTFIRSTRGRVGPHHGKVRGHMRSHFRRLSPVGGGLLQRIFQSARDSSSALHGGCPLLPLQREG